MLTTRQHLSALAAVLALGASAPAFAQTTTSGFAPTDAGTTVNGGVVKLDSNGQADGTSYENPNLNVAVENGDKITFEYKGPCGGGAPRVFIQGGAYNTFDADPNGTTTEPACGTAIGDGWFRVTTTVSGITNGTAGHTGIVNDNVSSPSTILVRNLTIGGVSVPLAPGPRSADQCKNGGWQAGGFRNQGQCVSSFQSNRPR